MRRGSAEWTRDLTEWTRSPNGRESIQRVNFQVCEFIQRPNGLGFAEWARNLHRILPSIILNPHLEISSFLKFCTPCPRAKIFAEWTRLLPNELGFCRMDSRVAEWTRAE